VKLLKDKKEIRHSSAGVVKQSSTWQRNLFGQLGEHKHSARTLVSLYLVICAILMLR
jgi:hypothetical protein